MHYRIKFLNFISQSWKRLLLFLTSVLIGSGTSPVHLIYIRVCEARMPRKYTCVANYARCPLLFRASTTFSGLIGNSLIRMPIASLTAFAIVANVGVMGGSPTPLAP